MSINPLNGPGMSSSLAGAILPTQKISTNAVPSTVTTEQAEIDNKTESEKQIKQAMHEIQGAVENLAHDLHFSIDEDTGQTIIKVMDASTKEVIRQMPTEEALNIARTLDKVQGLLFNDKA